MPVPELAKYMGGTGRAKLLWEALKEGDHPLLQPEGVGLSEKARNIVHSILGGLPLIATDVSLETASDCGTRKFLQKLSDGQSVESVLIPSGKYGRTTLCVSTQIGCDRGCAFCLTGTMGLLRNLTGVEIVSQVRTQTFTAFVVLLFRLEL
jgi:23S rRNA (adenine2503-C2)-methyltransferase